LSRVRICFPQVDGTLSRLRVVEYDG